MQYTIPDHRSFNARSTGPSTLGTDINWVDVDPMERSVLKIVVNRSAVETRHGTPLSRNQPSPPTRQTSNRMSVFTTDLEWEQLAAVANMPKDPEETASQRRHSERRRHLPPAILALSDPVNWAIPRVRKAYDRRERCNHLAVDVATC